MAFLPSDPADCGSLGHSLEPITVYAAPSGDCEEIGYVTVLDDDGQHVCQAPSNLPAGVTLSEYLVYASTQAMQGTGGVPGPAVRSSLGEPDIGQLCVDAGLRKELSLCAEERMGGALGSTPFCFWTDTTRAPAGAENRFRQCASCSDGSCTTSFPPLRSWKIRVS